MVWGRPELFTSMEIGQLRGRAKSFEQAKTRLRAAFELWLAWAASTRPSHLSYAKIRKRPAGSRHPSHISAIPGSIALGGPPAALLFADRHRARHNHLIEAFAECRFCFLQRVCASSDWRVLNEFDP
jgi:hypothetical protein